jgi:hypothetical protein
MCYHKLKSFECIQSNRAADSSSAILIFPIGEGLNLKNVKSGTCKAILKGRSYWGIATDKNQEATGRGESSDRYRGFLIIFSGKPPSSSSRMSFQLIKFKKIIKNVCNIAYSLIFALRVSLRIMQRQP